MKSKRFEPTVELKIVTTIIFGILFYILIGFGVENFSGLSAVTENAKNTFFGNLLDYFLMGVALIVILTVCVLPFLWLYDQIKKSYKNKKSLEV